MSDYDPLIKVQAAMFAVRTGLTTPAGDGVVFSYPVRGSRELSSDIGEALLQAKEVGLSPATEEQIEHYLSWQENKRIDHTLWLGHFKVSRKYLVKEPRLPAYWVNQVALHDGRGQVLESVEIPCETYFDEKAPNDLSGFGCKRVRSNRWEIQSAIEQLGDKFKRFRLARTESNDREISGADYLKLKAEAEAEACRSDLAHDYVQAYMDGLNRLYDPGHNTDEEHERLFASSPSYRAGYEGRSIGKLSPSERVGRFDQNLLKAGGRKLNGIRLRPVAAAKLARFEAITNQSVTAILNHLLETTDELCSVDGIIEEW